MNTSIKISLSRWLVPAAAFLVLFSSCKDDEPTLGNAPSDADAKFTYAPSSVSDNIIEFTAANSSLTAKWDFGNGQTGEGATATSAYPYAGSYTVKLTVFNSGGSNSSTQTVVIAQDDPSLLANPIFDLLTGGTAGSGSKTWVIDSASAGHFGVGPNPSSAAGDIPEWYAAQALEKQGSGMYDDRYTFYLQGFGFDQVTGGDVYVNGAHAGTPPFDDTAASPVADYIAQFPDQLGEAWLLTEGADTTLTISGDAMIGYWTGTRTYEIINIEENELMLRFLDTKDAGLAWYIRLIPEGYVGNPQPPATDASFPIDFESVEPTITTFGNSTAQVINNPDATGINTSARVLETVHGNETWAGFFMNLDQSVDFAAKSTIKLKVWAPDTGTFKVKFEQQADPNVATELDMKVTTKNTWEEITFDFSGSTSATYDRIVLFPGWNVANAGTFYVDDVVNE